MAQKHHPGGSHLLRSKIGTVVLLTHILATSFTNALSITRGSGSAQLEVRPIPRTIEMPLGMLTGVGCSIDAGVTQYLGVPFAEPPVGEYRFRPAEMHKTPYPAPSLMATTIPPPCGSICSLSTTPLTDTSEAEALSSEDCLYLNIWAPATAPYDGVKRPVRVYIHGGAVNVCSASDEHLNGCPAVARTGMIHVNIQFRRGPFGLFAHPLTFEESNTTGNWAFLDQQLALRWVQENIAYFGGDPNKVMLNGQSGGAQLVELHQVAPGSAGLFSSAISQSPPCVKLLGLDEAYDFSQKFTAMAGCAPLESPAAELACMRAAPWASLMAISRTIAGENFARLLFCEGAMWFNYFHYTLDKTVFPNQPQTALALGHFHRVPFMVGSTTNEGAYFTADLTAFLADRTEPTTMVPALLEMLYPSGNFTKLLTYYLPENYPGDKKGVDLMAHLWTDIFYTCPIHKRLVARNSHPGVVSYLYNWNITASCPPEAVDLGPAHTAEIRFTFGITENISSTKALGGSCDYTPEEVKVSDAVLAAWVTMAEEQVPRWKSGVAWPRWRTTRQQGVLFSLGNNRVQFLVPDDRCKVIDELFRVGKLAGPG